MGAISTRPMGRSAGSKRSSARMGRRPECCSRWAYLLGRRTPRRAGGLSNGNGPVGWHWRLTSAGVRARARCPWRPSAQPWQAARDRWLWLRRPLPAEGAAPACGRGAAAATGPARPAAIRPEAGQNADTSWAVRPKGAEAAAPSSSAPRSSGSLGRRVLPGFESPRPLGAADE